MSKKKIFFKKLREGTVESQQMNPSKLWPYWELFLKLYSCRDFRSHLLLCLVHYCHPYKNQKPNKMDRWVDFLKYTYLKYIYLLFWYMFLNLQFYSVTYYRHLHFKFLLKTFLTLYRSAAWKSSSIVILGLRAMDYYPFLMIHHTQQ